MLVHTPFMKSCEWDTITRMPGYLASSSSSHTHDSMSRWLVGSSSRSIAGWLNSALDSATRILHPPDRSFVFLAMKSRLKPRPMRISVARTSKVLGFMRSIRS
mmetsp:Transcript_1263/g.2730  ORF Transcript_1263/g.2730 Transcript_1263/m.2730 type:complete len:103 (-) Transcript_1263:671-979(-)